MKMIAFWKYDTFPFVLWSELAEADETSFKVKGYGGMRFKKEAKLAFLPEVQAKSFIKAFKEIEDRKKDSDRAFEEEAETLRKLL